MTWKDIFYTKSNPQNRSEIHKIQKKPTRENNFVDNVDIVPKSEKIIFSHNNNNNSSENTLFLNPYPQNPQNPQNTPPPPNDCLIVSDKRAAEAEIFCRFDQRLLDQLVADHVIDPWTGCPFLHLCGLNKG